MKNFLHRLLRVPAPREIALIDVPTDAERAAALDARAKAARDAMGRTWVCHRHNWVTSKQSERHQEKMASAQINRAEPR